MVVCFFHMKKFFKIMKVARAAIALAVFCLISALFFDLYFGLPKPYFMHSPFATQFVPSLLKMSATGGILAGAAFITFSAAALLFGRAYCSFFCVFGIMMDGIRKIFKFPAENSRLKKTAFGKFFAKRFGRLNFAPAHNIVRGAFLCAAILAIATGFTSLLGFIDPYSLYGKIMGAIFRPAASFAADAVSHELYSRGIYALGPINGNPAVALSAFGIALFILLAITAAAALRGRVYCNTICPVGAWLGLHAKFSLFKIELDKQSCISCGMCERECKAQCINAKAKESDFSRCVLCFNCGTKCPKNAIRFRPNGTLRKLLSKAKTENAAASKNAQSAKRGEAAMKRRAFPAAMLSLAGLFCIAAGKERKGKSRMKRLGKGNGGECGEVKILDGASPYGVSYGRADKRLTTPPGSVSLKNFSEHCTGCLACTAECEGQILKPSITEWGLGGIMQPFMDYRVGFCTPTCHNCGKACPTGAINLIMLENKMSIKMGTAIFKKCLCVVETDGTDCAACAEHCPVQAIEMIPYGDPKKSKFIPHVHDDVCIGCGACEYICPVLPDKAIVVQGLAEHRKAKKFEESMRLYKPQEKPQDYSAPTTTPDNPFPF